MGKDKFENDELIRYGWPEDIWFHVKDLSSAHVYLRLKQNESINDIPEKLLQECAQLCKFNSIEGSKRKEVDINYTTWSNLVKTKTMVPGEVAFKCNNEVKVLHNVAKDAQIINRINKTRIDLKVDLKMEREDRDNEEKNKRVAHHMAEMKRKQELEEQRKKEQELWSYDKIMNPANMTSNEQPMEEDDFM